MKNNKTTPKKEILHEKKNLDQNFSLEWIEFFIKTLFLLTYYLLRNYQKNKEMLSKKIIWPELGIYTNSSSMHVKKKRNSREKNQEICTKHFYQLPKERHLWAKILIFAVLIAKKYLLWYQKKNFSFFSQYSHRQLIIHVLETFYYWRIPERSILLQPQYIANIVRMRNQKKK